MRKIGSQPVIDEPGKLYYWPKMFLQNAKRPFSGTHILEIMVFTKSLLF